MLDKKYYLSRVDIFYLSIYKIIFNPPTNHFGIFFAHSRIPKTIILSASVYIDPSTNKPLPPKLYTGLDIYIDDQLQKSLKNQLMELISLSLSSIYKKEE